jgi:hypothetical protein
MVNATYCKNLPSPVKTTVAGPEHGPRIPKKKAEVCLFPLVHAETFRKTQECPLNCIKNRFFIPAGCAVLGLYLQFGLVIPVPVDLEMENLKRLAGDGRGKLAFKEGDKPWSNIPALVAVVVWLACNGGRMKRSKNRYSFEAASRTFLCLGTGWRTKINSKTGRWGNFDAKKGAWVAKSEPPSWDCCEPLFHFVQDSEHNEQNPFKRARTRTEETLSLQQVITVLLLNVGPDNRANYLTGTYRKDLDTEIGRFCEHDMHSMETKGQGYPLDLMKFGIFANDMKELTDLTDKKNIALEKEQEKSKPAAGGGEDGEDGEDDEDGGDDEDDEDDTGKKPKAKTLKDRVTPLVSDLISGYEETIANLAGEDEDGIRKAHVALVKSLRTVCSSSAEDLVRLTAITELYSMGVDLRKPGVKHFKQKNAAFGNYSLAVAKATRKGMRELFAVSGGKEVIQEINKEGVASSKQQKDPWKKLVGHCFDRTKNILPRNSNGRVGGTLVLEGSEDYAKLEAENDEGENGDDNDEDEKQKEDEKRKEDEKKKEDGKNDDDDDEDSEDEDPMDEDRPISTLLQNPSPETPPKGNKGGAAAARKRKKSTQPREKPRTSPRTKKGKHTTRLIEN